MDFINKNEIFKVTRPTTATIGGLLTIVPAILALVFWALGLFYISLMGFLPDYFAIGLYEFIVYFMVLIGGIFIMKRKYKLGGGLAIFFGISCTILYWFFGIWTIIGGILSLVSKEEVTKPLLSVVKSYRRISIGNIAVKLGVKEADAELAIIKLQSLGEPLKFNKNTREVIYIEPKICSRCGEKIQEGYKFCISCGEVIHEPATGLIKCSKCGNEYKGNYCPECGRQAESNIAIARLKSGFYPEYG